MTDDADVKALEKRIGEWSCLETVQQVFTDGYFKNRTAAGSAIFQAGEILSDAKKAIRSARQQERAACAVRYCHAKGDTFSEMQDAAHASPLYADGDMILVWVNEGDIIMHGQAIEARATGEGET